MKLSLSRLLFCIGIFFCTLLLVATDITSRSINRISQENAAQLRESIVKSAAQRMEDSLDEVTDALRSFGSRSAVIDFASDSAIKKFEKVSMLRSVMDDMTQYVPLVKNVHLVLSNGQHLRSSYMSDSRYGWMEEYQEAEALIETLNVSRPFYHTRFTEILATEEKAVLAVAAPIINTKGFYLGACIAMCDMTAMSRFLPGNMPAVLLYQEQAILSNQLQWSSALQQATDRVVLDKQAHAVLRENLSLDGCQIVCAYPLEQWQEIALSYNSVLLIIGVLIVAISTMLWMVHRMIVEPIESITKQMEGTTHINKPIVNRHRERNELTRLANGINELTDRINGLNSDILRVSQEKYQLQLDQLSDRVLLLQTQVNPHFLYNNLECIRGMAFLGNMEGVREMAVCMAHVARYCVKGEMSTIRQEIECVNHYFRIICLRYDDVYSLHIAVPEEVMDHPCPRMILQPMVENAVFHGFVHAKRHSGRIDVEASLRENGRICLIVEDNGVGLDQIRLDQMNEEFRNMERNAQQKLHERIGLYNVNYRLCLMTTQTSGIHLEKSISGGLRASVTFLPQTE